MDLAAGICVVALFIIAKCGAGTGIRLMHHNASTHRVIIVTEYQYFNAACNINIMNA